MFRDRNEELSHLIELYQRTSPTICLEEQADHLQPNPKTEILLAEIEAFSTVMINNMIEDEDLDLEFVNKLYEFQPQLFLTIFNRAISTFYLQIGFNEILRIVGELKYFSQAIEGYSTIYDQIKDNLSNFHEQSYKLREKLEKMTYMNNFAKLEEKEKSRINNMLAVLQPYAVLPKPVESRRCGNWAEHYFFLGHIENKFEDEKNKYISLFRTET